MVCFHVFAYAVLGSQDDWDNQPRGGMNDYLDSFDTLYEAVQAVEREANIERFHRNCVESTIAIQHEGKLIELIYSSFIDRRYQYWNCAVDDKRIQEFVSKLQQRK